MDRRLKVHLPRRRRRAAYGLLRPLFLQEERSLSAGRHCVCCWSLHDSWISWEIASRSPSAKSRMSRETPPSLARQEPNLLSQVQQVRRVTGLVSGVSLGPCTVSGVSPGPHAVLGVSPGPSAVSGVSPGPCAVAAVSPRPLTVLGVSPRPCVLLGVSPRWD